MAISLGATGGRKKVVDPVMNVTPLVDVVLVLLIIFMVVTPLLSKNFWVHLPKQEKQEVAPDEQQDTDPPLVLRVGPDRSIQVNGAAVGLDELSARLKRMFAARDDHVLFFDADDDTEYGFDVEVLDQARDGGAVTIAPLVEGLTQQGQPDGAAPAAAAPEATPPDPTAPVTP